MKEVFDRLSEKDKHFYVLTNIHSLLVFVDISLDEHRTARQLDAIFVLGDVMLISTEKLDDATP